jgi:chromosome segregation ATPase
VIPRQQIEEDFARLESGHAEMREELKGGAEKVHDALGELRTRVEDRFDALDEKRSKSIASLHGNVNDVRDRVASVEATVKGVVQSQFALDAKIDRLRSDRAEH